MFQLTEEGRKMVLNIVSEFCHGFNLEEIAANGDYDADSIKALMMMLCSDAGVINVDWEAFLED